MNEKEIFYSLFVNNFTLYRKNNNIYRIIYLIRWFFNEKLLQKKINGTLFMQKINVIVPFVLFDSLFIIFV